MNAKRPLPGPLRDAPTNEYEIEYGTSTPLSVEPTEWKLALRSVDFDSVEYVFSSGGAPARPVSVIVGSARTWCGAMQFPHTRSEGGESTGDDLIDEAIRTRAAEEMVRLESYARAVTVPHHSRRAA